MSVNLHHLRYFRAVAHEGSLTRAAERLNLSQSALSSQIRLLEARIGHELFERRGRALHLTEAGRIALDHADRIQSESEDLIATLSRRGSGRKALRVGALSTLSRNLQLDFLRPVLGRGDVEIILRSGTPEGLLPALRAMALDVVLTNAAPPRDAASPFRAHAIAEQPISLVAKPGQVAQGVPLRDVLGQEALILPTVETAMRAGFDALTDRLGLQPRIAAEVDDMAMMRLLAREGAGLAVLPQIVVTDELTSGALVEVARLEGLVERFYAVTINRRFGNPVLAELLA